MDELLALLGQHWRLVLLYPGGLTALAATAAVAALRGVRVGRRLDGVEVAVAACWLALCSLLPLPQAGWSYDIDLVTALLALEVPYLLLLSRDGDAPAAERQAALLAVYPLLALAAAALGQASGSWVLHDINRSGGLLHWIGLLGWSLALPPLLGIGPWRTAGADVPAMLRRAAHLGLLVSAAVPANAGSWRLGALAGFVAVLLPLAALDRRWRADPWRALGPQPWLCLAMLAAIAAVSVRSYLARF